MKRMTPCNYDDATDWKYDLEDTFKEISSKPEHPYSTKYTVLVENKIPGEDTLRNILTNILPQILVYRTKKDAERANSARVRAQNKEKQPKKAEDKKIAYSLDLTQPPAISRIVNGLVFFLPRFAIAFISGASLIVPMIIMTLNRSLTKSLITTSAAVLLLAGVLSFIVGAKNYDIITATATYAAVLVVFVGLSS
jgi:hypothetical protein